ncbi:hypothetical protein AAC387_Pa09g1374 [Persea americana]
MICKPEWKKTSRDFNPFCRNFSLSRTVAGTAAGPEFCILPQNKIKGRRQIEKVAMIDLKRRTKDLGLEVIVIEDDLAKKKIIRVSVAWKPATARVLVTTYLIEKQFGWSPPS